MTRSDATIVYLIGHGFSGSTLLTMLLNAHPGIATVGELGISGYRPSDRRDFRCSCQALIGDCAFWRRVSTEMARCGHTFDIAGTGLLFRYSNDLADRLLAAHTRGPMLEVARSAALALCPAARRNRDAFLSRYDAFVQVVTAIKGCAVFLDASKRPERALHLRRLNGYRIKIVEVVRDGRAVANSCVKNLGVPAEHGARSWMHDCQATARTRRYFRPGDWLTVRYEDLCADVPGTLARVFDFIGVAAHDVSGFRDCEHHIIGNRMRLERGSEIRLDESWRSQLPSDTLARVSRVVARLNAAYGYEGSALT
jgi:hypothetical protein